MDGGCGGDSNHPKLQIIFNIANIVSYSLQHRLTLFMSCWEKDGGLDVVHIVLKLAGILDPEQNDECWSLLLK